MHERANTETGSALEAATVIRSMERKDAKEIPILAMAANACAEGIERARSVGLNAHLPKPLIPEVLYKEIAQAIGRNAKLFIKVPQY